MNSPLRNGPTVCCVADLYCIAIPTQTDCLVSIKVGDKVFYDHSNGIRISNTSVHKIFVPMNILDEQKSYTLQYKQVVERLAYSVTYGEQGELKYSFKPLVFSDSVNIYHLSDTHGLIDEAVCAARYFSEKPDLLILNGDIAPDSESENAIFSNYDICYSVTGGERPCIITRGNHDLRGFFAEKLGELLPDFYGRSYYPVYLNGITFVVLDCGEDKLDNNVEYSGSICCHEFRLEEDAFLRKLLSSDSAKNSDFRILLSHIPICFKNILNNNNPYEFFIEDDMYTSWCNLIKSDFKPDFYLAGHIHKTGLFSENNPFDDRDISVPLVLGGMPLKNEKSVVGTAIILNYDSINIKFTDSKLNVCDETVLRLEKKK